MQANVISCAHMQLRQVHEVHVSLYACVSRHPILTSGV